MGKVTVYGYECLLIITHVAICLVSVKSSNVTDSERSDFEFESKNSVGVVFVCLVTQFLMFPMHISIAVYMFTPHPTYMHVRCYVCVLTWGRMKSEVSTESSLW